MTHKKLRLIGRFALCTLLVFASAAFAAQESRNVRLTGRWFSEEPPENSRDSRYNDVWGFERDGKEYAVIGSTNGTHIIHIPADNALREVAYIPGGAQGDFVIHRDYATYGDYLYAVCDQQPSALQVIDLRNLPESAEVVFASDAFFTTAHNVYADAETGKIYVSGTSIHALTVLSPFNPDADPQIEVLTNFDGVQYVHDVYARNDTAYLHAAFEGLFIFDFSTPQSPQLLGSLTEYPDQGYNHSGWLNAAGDVYVMTDETPGTRLKVLDVGNLPSIEVLGFLSSQGAPHTMAHNVVVEDDLAYVSYYFDGLQVFDIGNPASPQRIAWYDTYTLDEEDYRGAWGVHKGLPSGRILISDRRSGLFVFHLEEGAVSNFDDLVLWPNPSPGDAIVQVRRDNFFKVEHRAFDARGRLVDEGTWRNTSDTFWFRVDLSGQKPGMYFIEVIIDEGTPKVLRYIKSGTP